MKKETILSLIFTIITLTGCSVLNSNNQDHILFELERTGCYGTCPVYELKVYTSGKAVLEGKKHMDKIGIFKAKLDQKNLEQLINDFESASFFELENSYRSQFKDLPTKYITYHKNGKSKQIMAYDNIPENLQMLIDELDKLVNELEWNKIE